MPNGGPVSTGGQPTKLVLFVFTMLGIAWGMDEVKARSLHPKAVSRDEFRIHSDSVLRELDGIKAQLSEISSKLR